MQPRRPFDYLALLEHLAASEVEFVLIGGVCAVAQGVPVILSARITQKNKVFTVGG